MTLPIPLCPLDDEVLVVRPCSCEICSDGGQCGDSIVARYTIPEGDDAGLELVANLHPGLDLVY